MIVLLHDELGSKTSIAARVAEHTVMLLTQVARDNIDESVGKSFENHFWLALI